MKTPLAALVLAAAMPVAAASPSDIDYRSATARYSPYRESPVEWRAANDAIAPMHGRMGHMVATPSMPPGTGASDKSPAPPAANGMGHDRHRMGGRP